jgi:hypothetical protein
MKNFDKHHFRIKGAQAEEALHQLAFKSFLKEWCHPNPKRDDGKEICDLLVLFDDQLAIIQIKDIRFSGNDERYIRKAIDDPCKQILGAERTLFEKKQPIILTNPFGHSHQFEPEKVSRVIRLVVSVGDGDVPFNAVRDLGDKTIHIFDKSVETVLNELDTIADFSKYLSDKEQLLMRSDFASLTMFREADLLGDYIFHGKSFDHLKGLNAVHYEEGIWEEVTSKSDYIAKQEADRISYFWDFLVDFAHECKEPEYREIARELSRLDRFDRRCASESFFSAHELAEKRGLDFRRTWELKGVTYVYVFTPADRARSQRVAQLRDVCTVARHKLRHNSRVIGIATEIGKEIPHSYDFVFMDFPEWSEENQRLAEELQKEQGILTDPILRPVSIQEYPENPKGSSNRRNTSEPGSARKGAKKVGRNDPCPCGSGKKYKKCHGR